jgi:hypothetical protein
MLSVLSHERLNIHKISNYNANLLHELCLDSEELEIVDNEINTNNNGNYKFIKLEITNIDSPIIYHLIHGFPGDEPVGFILLSNGSYESINNSQSTNLHIELIVKWYKMITNDECDYDNDFWY